MNYDVIAVHPYEYLKLRVMFRDGLQGEVVFSKNHLTGIFKPLDDPAFFNLVVCEHGFVSWPGEIDLAPDAMYEAVKDKGVWFLD